MASEPEAAVVSALLLSALIADAAVETFWRGSPVRWTVVAIAAAYMVASVLMWARSSRRTKLTASMLTVALILALPAWLPGGLDNGVRLLGLSTSTVLALASALGIAIGAVVIAAELRVPRVVRLIAAVLGAYGVVAFAQGIFAGLPFRTMLSGGSFWTRLPLLLQGAVIGGAVVSPAALILVVATAGLRRPRDGTTARALHQITACATSLVVVLSGLLFARSVPSHVPAVPARTSTPGTAVSDHVPQAVDDMDLFDLVDRSRRLSTRFRRADDEVPAKAEELGPGIEPAFSFVRDEIRYEPYAGVLRGAAGTYATRAGNAVDRSLLLADLLRAKGVTTRFAVGTLESGEAERLFAHAFDHRTPSPTGEVQRLDQGDLFYQRLFRRARQDYDVLRAALGAGLKPVTAPSRETVLAEMNPHVWLQAQTSDGWIDLDPSLPDSIPGHTIAAIDRTVDQLSDDQYQRVTIRVIGERLSEGTLVPSTYLEVARNAVDLIDTQVVLMHTHPMSATGLGSAIVRSLGHSTGDRWMPALWIAGDFTFGQSLDAAAGDFVAEWLEFEIAWPNGRREVTRRALIDRGGSAWRAAARLDVSGLKPVARDESGALAMQALHNVWFSAGSHRLSDFAEATRLALLDEAAKALAEHDSQNGAMTASERETLALPSDDDAGKQVWPFVLQNFSSMIWTDNVILPLLDRTPGIRLYAESPRITIFSTGPVGGGSDAVSMDLRRDDLRGIAIDSSKAALVADGKLRFAALQGALEHETMAELTSMATGSAVGVRSTSGMLAGRQLTALGTRGPVRAADRDTTVELAAALDLGRIVVTAAGEAPVPHAWWEILPDTGDVRSVADSGLLGSRTPPLDRNNPFRINKKLQQNPFGGQKTWDARSPEERLLEQRRKIYEAKRAEAEEKAFAEAAKYRNSLAQPQQAQARGGGSEYAVLLTIGTVAKIALHVLSYFLLMKLFEQIELLASWLADGGFQAAWP